jgi:hypothetical protein
MEKIHYVVDYEYQTGEYGIPKQKLIEGNYGDNINKILDSYFEGFFDENTYKDGNLYVSSDDCQFIKITGHKLVPIHHVPILKQYFR